MKLYAVFLRATARGNCLTHLTQYLPLLKLGTTENFLLTFHWRIRENLFAYNNFAITALTSRLIYLVINPIRHVLAVLTAQFIKHKKIPLNLFY